MSVAKHARKRFVFIGKCTTCKKLFELTEQQRTEARDLGCAFSPCCFAVATIESVRAAIAAAEGRS